jgi:2-polyprenyl-6-methoxyphenol hydroxylase-like FAD-dependent oxidoreductase
LKPEEQVLVIGAGIAGLCTALALAPTGRRITILERDDDPPTGDTDAAFRDWKRKGVGHLRQSHAFLARLHNIIRDEHPELLADLLAAGCREITFADMLTDAQRAAYQPKPGDHDLTILTSRRTTLELLIRRYVQRQPNVTIRTGVMVHGVTTGQQAGGPRVVTGVTVEDADGRHDVAADLVIDAGGKGSVVIESLIEAGAPIREESETAGILYFTRHYRLLPGVGEPPRGKIPPSGDLGFLKFGVFPADNGCFSITVCVPEIEMELRKAVFNPDTFNAICQQMPGLQPWLRPDVSEPTTKVFGMGDLHSRWRELLTADGEPAVLGFLCIGDALARTNPLYGRGCSFAAVGAYVVRQVLDASDDPAERLRLYDAAIKTEILPFFEDMRTQDRSAIRRARAALTPGYRPRLKARLAQSFIEDGIRIAVRSDIGLMRQAMRGFHMLEHPSAWLKKPANMMRVLGYWARGKKANAAAYPPPPGPDREDLMRSLGLSPDADMRTDWREAA